jgi:hypothetical protein
METPPRTKIPRWIPLILQAVTVPSLAAQGPTAPLEPPVPRPTVQALATDARLLIDGRLDEPAWKAAVPVSGFRTVSPAINEPSAYRTVVRTLSTPRGLVIGAFLADSLGTPGLRVQDLRRDFDRRNNDYFQVVLDPLHDTRTSVSLQVTPYGSLRDAQAFDGGDLINDSWDGVWSARTAVTDSGWTVELEIPWASLRYDTDGRPWGVNFARSARRTLEVSALVPFPRQFSAYRMAFAADLHGVQPPPASRSLRVRPFILGDASRLPRTTDRQRTFGQLGGEVLYAPSANTLLEVTANTDFAQADVDRQVVNLRRFSVFFPERRQFFLENTDVLAPSGVNNEFVVQPFFTRRIGLGDDGNPVPIDAGGRYTWRSARASAGALAVRQGGAGAAPGATFGVLRGSRFLGRATRVGAFAAVRDDDASPGRPGARNVVTAIDGLTRLGETVQVNGMLSTSTSGDTTGVAATYFAGRETPGLYTGLLGAFVDERYAPRTGFVSRTNLVLTSPAVIGTVQPAWRPKGVVWFKPAVVSWLYHTPATGALQEGYVQAYVDVLHTNGALWYPYVERHFQRPTAAVALLDGVTIAAGTHDYTRTGLYAGSDPSARVALSGNVSTGTFFDGTLDAVTSTLRIAPSPRVALVTTVQVNRLRQVGTRDADVTTHLLAPELRLFATPRLQVSGFYQYNTDVNRGTLNARVSWEFAPLSFAYLVFNDRRGIRGNPERDSQQLVLKIVWLRQL